MGFFGIFLVAWSVIFDFFTLPLYWILQNPRHVKADRTRKRAVISDAGSGRIRYRHNFQGQLDDTMKYITAMPNKTLVEVLDVVCAKYGQRDCVGSRRTLGLIDGQFGGKPVKKISKSGDYDVITFAEFKSSTQCLATGLRKKYSLGKGDKVLIFANSRAEWLIAAVGCIKAGAVVTTLVPSMTKQAIAYAMDQIKPKLIVTEISLREKLQESLSAQKETSDSTRQVPPVILMEADGQSLPRDAILLKDIESYGSKAGVAYEPVALKSTDTAVLMYTSGTTSMAKGVNLTHGQLVESIFGYTYFAMHFSPLVGQKLRFLQFLPLSHIFALSVSLHVIVDGNCLLFGSPYTLTDASLLTVKGEKGDLTVARPHYMIAIPLILQRLKDGITKKIREKGAVFEELFNFCMAYKKKWVDLGYTTPIVDAVFFSRITKILGGSLSHVIVGGAPMGDDLQTFCRNVLCTVTVQGYGCTETGGLASCQDKESKETGSVGYPPINGSILLESWDEGGYSVDDNENPSGEILLVGPNVADSYYMCSKEENNSAFQLDVEQNMRMFRTGDIGRINLATNSLSIIDRKSQLIKLQNGEYISLGRIETALQGSPFVEQACVFARPQKRGSVALIVPDRAVCRKMTNWKSDSTPAILQNGSTVQQAGGRINDEVNASLLLSALSNELKDSLSRYEIPMAVALVDGPWTPETGLVTGALKIKRKAIQEKYKSQVERLFSSI